MVKTIQQIQLFPSVQYAFEANIFRFFHRRYFKRRQSSSDDYIP